jgi:predicted transcriptional regulator
MRTTVRLPDELHARAKQRAAESGMTFTELLEEALRLVLRDADPVDQPEAGVDLTDSAALVDLMEGR